MRLYEPSRHLPLLPDPWDEGAVRAAITEIVEDALDRFEEARFWPPHSLDEGSPDPSTGMYFGAAGVIWALDYLHRQGAAGQGRDFTPSLPLLLRANAAESASTPYPMHGSLLMGDVGVRLVAMRLCPSAAMADALFERVAGNDHLPVLELMWGTPGTMLACVFMGDITGEERWRDAYRRQARRLLSGLEQTDSFGSIWTQKLYGETRRYLGAVHGYAGNMWALLRGWHWLDAEQRDRIADAVPRTLVANARSSKEEVNWPAIAEADGTAYLVQICHGAPGMVTAAADAPFASTELDAMLRAAGNLIWRAGPLTKGSNLCHGTAGNGYALLKLHRRFGAPLWLDRARAFAMTAITQSRAARRRYGRGRYALWTGDLGLAVYLRDCITAKPRFPSTEVF